MNSVAISGNLTSDVDVNYVGEDDTPVLNGTVAEDHGYGTNFVPFVVWGSTAETIAEHFGKGDGIELTGSLEQDDYEDQDGNSRSQLQIRVSRFSFPQSGPSDNGDGSTDDFEDDPPF